MRAQLHRPPSAVAWGHRGAANLRPNLLLTTHGDHGNWPVPQSLQLTEYGVAKAEWGVKRTCLSCGARFYDLQREPITCPACGAAVDVTAQSKPRRARAAPVIAKVAAAPVLAVVEVEAVAVEDDVPLEADLADDEEIVETEAADEEAEEEDGESAIEDVSELGDDDMADVIDTELDEEETDR
jgi:uncharacterized protein (TIGR02300 family)